MPERPELELVIELVEKLLEKTAQNQVDWQPTGFPSELTAAFAGKYSILLKGGIVASLKVKNADGDEIVGLDTNQEPRIDALYDLAMEYVRAKVEAQLADLIKEIDNPSQSDERTKRAKQIAEIWREHRGKK